MRRRELHKRHPCEFVVLAGAGISIEEPSGIPAAQTISDALLRWVASNAKARSELRRRMIPGDRSNPYQFLRFEGLIQAIAEIDPNVFQFLESTQAFGGPNLNHRLLATMVLNGATVVTTNFDTRIEQAADDRYLSTFVLSSKRRAPRPEDRLIKIHGSFPWKRGRNVTPRATLTQIGKLGLGFEHFPAFQEWFRSETAGKHLIVIGYSASDSFDVVPLIENCSKANTVTWFSYRPGTRGLREVEVRRREGSAAIPFKRSIDFAAHTLSNLASRAGTPCAVYLVNGTDVHKLLTNFVRLREDTFEAPTDNSVGLRNLNALRKTLSENGLTAYQQSVIRRLLDDGMFGESYATDIEPKPVRRGKQVTFVGSNARFSRGSAEQRAQAAFEKGNPDLAFRILEESARKTDDRDQILLLLHHFEFRFGEQNKDLRRLDGAIRKTERVSLRSGVLWGLIMGEWMKSFRLDAEWRAVVNREKRNVLSESILAHSTRVVYYGLRAGWQPWFSTAARLAAKHLAVVGEFDKATRLITSLLVWLDRETSAGLAEIAGTACVLNTLGIQSRRPGLIKAARRVLSSLDSNKCPVVKLLRIAAEAEVAHASRQWRRLDRLERSANEQILKVDPFDHWEVKAVFAYLRQSMNAGNVPDGKVSDDRN